MWEVGIMGYYVCLDCGTKLDRLIDTRKHHRDTGHKRYKYIRGKTGIWGWLL